MVCRFIESLAFLNAAIICIIANTRVCCVGGRLNYQLLSVPTYLLSCLQPGSMPSEYRKHALASLTGIPAVLSPPG